MYFLIELLIKVAHIAANIFAHRAATTVGSVVADIAANTFDSRVANAGAHKVYNLAAWYEKLI